LPDETVCGHVPLAQGGRRVVVTIGARESRKLPLTASRRVRASSPSSPPQKGDTNFGFDAVAEKVDNLYMQIRSIQFAREAQLVLAGRQVAVRPLHGLLHFRLTSRQPSSAYPSRRSATLQGETVRPRRRQRRRHSRRHQAVRDLRSENLQLAALHGLAVGGNPSLVALFFAPPSELRMWLDHSPLPNKPAAAVDRWLVDVYPRYWGDAAA
jgi:hypothetical protein